MNNKPAAGGSLMETIQALTAATLQFSHLNCICARLNPPLVVGNPLKKSPFLPPFQNQGKWDTLYMFMTSLDDPSAVIARPGGHIIAPRKGERVGDVSNVTFCHGWVHMPDGTVFIYYGGSDTRCYVARSTLDKLVDWCLNTPEDGLTTRGCVNQRLALIRANRAILSKS
ncbi:MAG: hypothetical protein J6386_09715 [Candidatus Synoicihabitans palmerolidicus]|nr:hypothetical protein [Candidatus Synoicihabitans palmerolidicus]